MISGGNDVDSGIVTGFFNLIDNLTDLWVGASEVKDFDRLLPEDFESWQSADQQAEGLACTGWALN